MDDQQDSQRHPLNARSDPQDYPPTRGLAAMDTRQAIAIALIVLGMIGVVVAWFGISGTLDPGEQMPYLASGGIGGAALIAVGVMMYVSWEHVQDRAVLGVLLQRLEAVEAALGDIVIEHEPDSRLAQPRRSSTTAATRKPARSRSANSAAS
jgi:hypothetical protein